MYCAFENCKKKPGYNTKGLKVSKFCVNHKEADMIHIKTDFCKEHLLTMKKRKKLFIVIVTKKLE